MADAMTVAIDKEKAIRALERLGDHAHAYVQTACLVTAQAVADEMRSRIARRTGETAEKIHWERSFDGKGYVVMAYTTGGKSKGRRSQQFHVDLWLEFGTVHMFAKPFLYPSAKLEEGPFMRRVEDALERAARNAEEGV